MSGTTDDDRLYGEVDEVPDPDAPIDTDSPKQKAAAEKKAERIERQRTEVLQAMLSQPSGRDLLAFVLFNLCGFTQSTIGQAETAEGVHTSNLFRAGQRDVALKLHQMLRRADKAGYVVLLTEHIDQM